MESAVAYRSVELNSRCKSAFKFFELVVHTLTLVLIMFLASKRFNLWRKLCTFSGVVQQAIGQADILVLGGNGFIGSECVSALLEKGHKLTLVNRGKDHFDYSTRIKPFVTEILCDRSKGLGQCKKFQEELSKYDFVIDFSSYEPNAIRDAIHHLKERFNRYIYISTDSVYEVCPPAKNNKKSKEMDAKRHSSKFHSDEDSKLDEYGHLKLQCEEALKIESEKEDFKYLVFRLPDVIGPRDTTLRFWTYQTWLQYHASSGEPLHLPKNVQGIVSSYVYVKDVAKVITDVVEKFVKSPSDKSLENRAYNLAFPEGFTLRSLLDGMQKILGVQDVEYRYSDVYTVLPSVTRGPLDITRAKRELEFKPTPWLQAFEETINFNKQAIYLFPSELYHMMYILEEEVAHLNSYYMIQNKILNERFEMKEKHKMINGKKKSSGDERHAEL